MSELSDNLSRARSNWDRAFSLLSEITDSQKEISTTSMSLEEMDASMSAAFELEGACIRNSEGANPALVRMIGGLKELEEQQEPRNSNIEAITNYFDSIEAQTVEAIDDNLQLQTPNGNQLPAGKHLANVLKTTRALVSKTAEISSFFGTPEIGVVADRAHEWTTIVREGRESLDEIKQFNVEAGGAFNAARKTQEEIQALATKAKGTADQSEESAAKAKAGEERVASRLTAIEEISTNAGELQRQVNEFSDEFKSFDEKLEARIEKFSSQSADSDKLIEKLREHEKETDRIIEKANDMIAGATVAGLSKRFDDARSIYERKAQRAAESFYLAIVVFFIVTASIAAYLIDVPIFRDNDTFSTQGIWGLVIRLVLIVPAIWYVQFTGRNHSVFQSLEREYAFKAALAQSVEGFKKEAPNYKEEIVAAIFTELTDKPSATLKVHSKSDAEIRNRPFRQVIERFLKKFDQN